MDRGFVCVAENSVYCNISMLCLLFGLEHRTVNDFLLGYPVKRLNIGIVIVDSIAVYLLSSCTRLVCSGDGCILRAPIGIGSAFL